MSKKADISVNTIVVAALALIVLVIMIFIFKGQIGNISSGFFSAGNDAKSGMNGTKCQTMLGGRVCGGGLDKYPDAIYEKNMVVPPVSGKWIDCEKTTVTDKNCYEITKKTTT